jgi:hypothetical protein
MPTRDDENPELNALCGGDPLARKLAVLQPLPAGLDRDRLLYAAGTAARDRAVAFWKRLCLGQGAALAVILGIGLMREGHDGLRNENPAGGMRQEWVDRSQPPPDSGKGSPAGNPPSAIRDPLSTGPAPGFAHADEVERGETAKWLQLRADIFAAGLGVMPTPHAPPPRADAVALEKSLQLPPGVLASPYAAPKAKPKPVPEEEK